MRTSRILLGFFYAPVLSVFWLRKHAVDSALISAPEVVKAAYGDSVTVPCQYSIKYRNYTKYWCRGSVYKQCKIIVKTPKNRDNDRVFIEDDKEAGVFKVTMTSLQRGDEDMYWCVVATRGINPHSGVTLRLSNSVMTPPTTVPTLTSHENLGWWGTLRWVVFILMLCCVVTTHIVTWRMKTTKKTWQHRESQIQNSNIYA